ncbi:phage antirepressor KilAC domain-containing protein [Burkholderia gladioli]|nr:phage antirepressor KilAC domain-containing protein [Burkholderia gladioli]
MPFIGGRRAREGQVRLVNAFIALRERAVPAAIDLTNPETLRGLLQSLAGQSLQLQQQVAVLSPKADALDRLGAAEGSLCITDAAKNLKVRPMALFKWLASSEWIYRRGATWIGYQAAIMRGLLEHRVTTIQRDDGTEKAATQVRITPKGLALLAKKMPEASQ